MGFWKGLMKCLKVAAYAAAGAAAVIAVVAAAPYVLGALGCTATAATLTTATPAIVIVAESCTLELVTAVGLSETAAFAASVALRAAACAAVNEVMKSTSRRRNMHTRCATH